MASKKKTKSSGREAKTSAKKAGTAKKAAPKTVARSSKKAPKKADKKTTAKKLDKKPAGKKAPAKPTPKKSTAKKAAVQKKSAVSKKSTAKKASTAKKSAQKSLPKKGGVKAAAKPSAAASAAQKAREKERLLKEKEKERKEKEREKERLLKEKERLLKEKEKEKERLLKEKERLQKEKEREKERLLKEKEKEKERLLKEKERLQKEKERETERLKKEKERLLKEKEREAERLKKEKEKEKERLRKEKEKERLLKEKEREVYRKAREAEREKVRAEKEAARRALEGRVAQQARRAQRIAGTGRGGSSRVYRPDAIPSQAGTRREGITLMRPPATPVRSFVRPSTPAPPPRPQPPASLEDRWAIIQKRLAAQPERFQTEYAESFDMSWIHHDSALEGVVYTYQELKTAVDPNIVIVPDSSLQPVCEEIRRHKKAIEWARELGTNDIPLSAEILKRLLLLLHPEEGDLKSVKYRKEIPQHRLYFHDYAAPDKIAVRIRQAFDWLHGPEPPKLKDPVRVAARLHYDLLRTFPFPQDSGKVARLSMNILLMRAGLPPVIIHSTERQRYYDALRGSLPTIVHMVNDSMRNAMTSIEKILDEEEASAANS